MPNLRAHAARPAGDFALVFVSNEDAPTSVTCDAECFGRLLGPAASGTYSARDLWAHQAAGQLSVPGNFTAHALAPNGGVAAFRFSPA